MGFRFKKSKKIAPGVRLNLGKKSAGISFGGKRGGISFNSKTGAKARASIPGTGISYSTKLGGKKKASRSSSAKTRKSTTTKSQKTVSNVPVPQRIWFVVLAPLCIFSGICYIPKGVATGLLTVCVGVIMTFFTYYSRKTHPRITDPAVAQQLQIFDESIKLFMETNNPETFFGRYQDAERAASAMAQSTKATVVHGEPPQAAVEMLLRQKTEVTNLFLDRYAKEIRTKAFQLTRGRKQKVESFKLITSEYEYFMTQESIRYRNRLYEDMVRKIQEI